MSTVKNKRSNRAVIYARYSSDNQRAESIDAQVRAAMEFADKHGLNVIKTYTDEARSATTDKRPKFQEMFRDVELKLFDVVIVHKLDRFSRDKYDSVIYKRTLKKNKVQLISVTEQLDDSPESSMLESMLEGMSEYYSRNLAREVMKGMRENALKCKHTGGRAPLGYDVDPITKQYVINEKEALAVREIFELYTAGCGYTKIIDALNAKAYKTKIGKAFGKNSLHDILANEKYCGTYTYNRASSKGFDYTRNNHQSKDDEDIIRIPDGMPAIVSKEMYEKVKAIMVTNKNSAGRYKAKENYLLSGLIYCGKCGSAMHGNTRYGGRNKTKYSTYRCSRRDRTKECDNKEVQCKYIEWFVLEQLEKQVFNEKAIPRLLEKLNSYQVERETKGDVEEGYLTKDLEKIQKEIDNIVAAIAEGCSQTVFKKKLNELDAEQAKLESRLSELRMEQSSEVVTEEVLRGAISMFQTFVKERNIPECKRFISSFVDKVEVFDNTIEVTIKVASFFASNSGFTFRVKEKTRVLFNQYKKVACL